MAAKGDFAVLEVFLSCCAEPLFDGDFSGLFRFSLENVDGVIISLRARQDWHEIYFCALLAAFLVNFRRFASFDLLLNQQEACCQPILRRHRQQQTLGRK